MGLDAMILVILIFSFKVVFLLSISHLLLPTRVVVQLLSRFRLFVTPVLQHIRLPCPSPFPGTCSNSCTLSQWCHPTISSLVVPFSCPQSFPASGSFPESWLCIRWPNYWNFSFSISSFQFSRSVMADSLQPHEPQHTRSPCPSPTPGVHPNPCPSSWWCHPTISSSVVPFSSCPQSFPASGSFQMSQLFTSGGQSIGVSASTSVLPMNTQDWSPLGWTGWISLQSKGLLVFSNTTVQKHQFFSTQLSL